MHKIGVVGDKDSILAFKAVGVDVYPVTNKEALVTLLLIIDFSIYLISWVIFNI